MRKLPSLFFALAGFCGFLSCTSPLDTPSWNNPLDRTGSNYHPPLLQVCQDTIVRWNDTLVLTVSAFDSNGSVDRFIWRKTTESRWDTTAVPTCPVIHPAGGHLLVIVGAIDNDQVCTYDTVSVLFNRSPESISLAYPKDGFRHIFDEIDFSDTMCSIIAYGLQASDPDSACDSLRFFARLTDSTGTTVHCEENAGQSFVIDSLKPGRHYFLRFVAKDRHDDSVSKEIDFHTQGHFPSGMVFFPATPPTPFIIRSGWIPRKSP